ncbi:hypothetical protein A2210_02340 [Candidatus Woesebacteria bacterium RIFOXYA1_FULL_40_18]|uniref:Uncharacterized protein n=1 Tax=Candidatus Woesebacteria bacterium RIFOXYA1_FULL_40_18 TaxID=1802532 RepID=A0A1F8CJG4_9BACT|nr:MAG: hypothetical protein A2210_02340 [Candidatus Woesebacteria bacterium RIFOXYA1_FULL_40_18]
MSDASVNKVNIGTKENPIFVPEKALKPDTVEGREWWGMISEGSVILEGTHMDALLKKLDEQKGQKP